VIKLLLLTPWRPARIVKFKPANEVITGQPLPIRRKFANDFEEPQRISANPPMISKSQALNSPGAMAAQYARFHNVVWRRSSDRDCKRRGTNPFRTPFNALVPLTRCLTFWGSLHSRTRRTIGGIQGSLWWTCFVAGRAAALDGAMISLRPHDQRYAVLGSVFV
jgi:hypothetical protein